MSTRTPLTPAEALELAAHINALPDWEARATRTLVLVRKSGEHVPQQAKTYRLRSWERWYELLAADETYADYLKMRRLFGSPWTEAA